ncbi:1-deoxy-D-xylulose 5-phosphate reductoisomerase [Spirochaetia bacterium]|nr:1-deoxy-D-xylulose 5-phosphate reductoisomerase [Spirochaetia bacterium]
MKKKTAVLGATGSIGKNTLDVLRGASGKFQPVLFSANSDAAALLKLSKEFPCAKLALTGKTKTEDNILSGLPAGTVFYGKEGLLDAIKICGADIAVNGIAGAAGLVPSIAVLESGADLALANKETIVMAAPLVFKKAKENNAKIIPVDSEHSAIFNLINAHGREALDEIILTASGGPFRNYTIEQLKNVTVKDALSHPTWSMGTKITVDSASLANKGLEVIEAARLFDMPGEKIKVTIHPQSIVHSMIRLSDGAVYAQLSRPDMRLPIHEALNYPAVTKSAWGVLDFENLTLTFEKPDYKRFPLLKFAYDALNAGGLWTVAYNAANETVVHAFINKQISFLEIPSIVEYVLNKDWGGKPDDLPSIMDADRKAREAALGVLC